MSFKYNFLLLIGFFTGLVTVILLRNHGESSSFFQLFAFIPHYDKVGHFFLMGILAFLAVITIAPLFPDRLLKSTIIILSVVLTLIALEEYSQLYIPTRTFSLQDFACDLLGVFAFGTLGYAWVRRVLRSPS